MLWVVCWLLGMLATAFFLAVATAWAITTEVTWLPLTVVLGGGAFLGVLALCSLEWLLSRAVRSK